MRDVKIKENLSVMLDIEQYLETGEKIIIQKSLYDFLPIDRVVTIDNNGYVYLYDQCIKISEDMIEEEL